MLSIVIKRSKVNLYESIYQMPNYKYSAFNGFLLRESGLVQNWNDIQALQLRLLAEKKEEKVTPETIAQRLFTGIANIEILSKSFACMVHSIGKTLNEDISNEGLTKVVERLTVLGPNDELNIYWLGIKKEVLNIKDETVL